VDKGAEGRRSRQCVRCHVQGGGVDKGAEGRRSRQCVRCHQQTAQAAICWHDASRRTRCRMPLRRTRDAPWRAPPVLQDAADSPKNAPASKPQAAASAAPLPCWLSRRALLRLRCCRQYTSPPAGMKGAPWRAARRRLHHRHTSSPRDQSARSTRPQGNKSMRHTLPRQCMSVGAHSTR
jgi:hypothetical protein